MESARPPETVYRLLPVEAWAAAQREGVILYDGKDMADGFLHLSSAEQLFATAARYFSKRTDMLALEIDAGMLGPRLKMEPATGGELFPHLYGALPLGAVRAAHPLAWRDGAFAFAQGAG